MPASPDCPLVADDRGNLLLSFEHTRDEVPPSDAPLPLALLALWHEEKVLLVFNRHQRSWELPGGMIEPCETPRSAAVRELWEESGQVPDAPITFVGHAHFALGPESRKEYGALFTGRTAKPRQFRPNEETSAAHWWDLDHLPGHVEPIDAYLARLARTA